MRDQFFRRIERNTTSMLCLLMLFSIMITIDAHAFRFEDSTGKTHILADYKGKWVLVNFWATWCPPCLKEIPDLVSLYESRKKDIMVIGIAMDYADPQTVTKYAEAMSISYPTVLGDRHIASQIDNVSMLPSTYLFDPAGNPAARKLGLITRESIEEFINLKSMGNMKNPHP